MTGWLSITGMYNYDNTIFDNMVIPTDINKNTLIDNIITELAEFEIIYPDIPFFKKVLASWSRKESPIWEKLYNTTQYDYDPIYNYDRTDRWTEQRNNDRNNTLNGNSQTTSNTTHSSTVTNSQTNNVYGFNSSAEVPAEKIDNNGTDTTTGNDTNTISTNNSENLKENEFITHENRSFGNIGVTTTQKMIESEREVVTFNIYDYITQSFKKRFCLLVY